MKLYQADELVLDDQHLVEYYGIESNDPATIDLLDNTRQPKQAMMGTPWYTVLSNNEYKEDFGYVGSFITEREKLIKDGVTGREGSDGEMLEEDIKHKWE
jgi:ribosomal protein S18